MNRSPAVPLILAGALLIATAAPFALELTSGDEKFSTTALSGMYLVRMVLALIGTLALLVATPRLRALPGTGGHLPGWSLDAALIATALTAATQFVQLFVVRWLGDIDPDLLDIPMGGVLMASMVASWVLYLLAWTIVGGLALRRRIVPVPAGVLLIIGAVLQPVFGPLAALPFGAALLMTARAARGSAIQVTAASATPIASRS
ncbi:hypothetical protein [Georgenia yuyongxinii]|uniref:DUF4386 family protein n=1 Tax=Georgenia yuyongxinii TaxID=2589797 RepID=A0A552WT15_9MICO|nr:hypothetical protein [Georgenia yuyongxinii]TRW45980.1 hypothetical protein FJ693_07435 [Georgenia yuyongxinii]